MQTEAANPKHYRIEAQFYVDPTYGPVCERKIGPKAGDDTVIEKVNNEHILAHPEAFARFQASRANIAPVGIPLKRGLGMDDDLVRLFNTHGIMDVETFASLEDSRFPALMPGAPDIGIEFRDRARMMVPEARRTPLAVGVVSAPVGPTSRAAAAQEIAELKAALARAEREKAGMLAMLEAATPPIEIADEPEDVEGAGETEAEGEGSHVRRGPGRPRKAQG